jgi:hypothetical protein
MRVRRGGRAPFYASEADRTTVRSCALVHDRDCFATALKQAELYRKLGTGLSTHPAAAELDRRGVSTPTGAKWSAMAVLRVRKRLAA